MGSSYKDYIIACYKLDGSLLKTYESARKACKSRHAHPRTIDKCIRGETSTAFNYMWRRYKKDEEIPLSIEPLKIKDKRINTAVKVYKVDENNNVLECYSSINEASKKNNLSSSSLSKYFKNNYSQINGLRFILEEDKKDDDKSISYISRPIIQYDYSNKQYIKSYKSIKEASKTLGISTFLISNVLTKKQKQTHGFYFRYKKL